ncbi:MAG: hypothetical protein ACRC5C_09785 [Bacilli bacterium]
MALYSETGAHGGYRLLKSRLLPPLFFTPEEGAELVTFEPNATVNQPQTLIEMICAKAKAILANYAR